jgi:hypothetical protein
MADAGLLYHSHERRFAGQSCSPSWRHKPLGTRTAHRATKLKLHLAERRHVLWLRMRMVGKRSK